MATCPKCRYKFRTMEDEDPRDFGCARCGYGQDEREEDRDPTLARYRRLFGFDAGPENHTFYLCEKHKDNTPMCFHPILDRTALLDEELEDDIQCDLCREG